MGLKYGAGTGGREAGVLNLLRAECNAVGGQVGEFAMDLDGDGFVGVGGGVKQVNRAELFIDQAAGAGLKGFKVEAVVGDNLGDLL